MAYAPTVKAVTTSNVNVLSAPSSFDGYSPSIGDRILLVSQTSTAQNGVWTWQGTGNGMQRPTALTGDEYMSGHVLDHATLFPVQHGNTYAGTCWGVDPAQIITVDKTGHTFMRVALPPIQVRVATTVNINLSSPAALVIDGSTVTDGSMTTGLSSTTLTCATSQPFTSADIGKTVVVTGAGLGAGNLTTTIAGYTSNSVVTLTTGCSTSVANATVQYGVTLNVGDLVLVHVQNTAADNGVYASNGSGGALSRTSEPLTAERRVAVSEGTLYAHTEWVLTTAIPIVLGTTALSFQRATTFYSLDVSSPALVPGDWVAPLPSDPTKITKAIPQTVLGSSTPPGSATILGCVDASYSPGASNVVIRRAGEVVPASVFTDLGSGAISFLQMNPSGRAIRKPAWSGGEIKCGSVDPSGNVTVDTFVPVVVSPPHTWSPVTFGAVVDGITDDYPAYRAMLDAMPDPNTATTSLTVDVPLGTSWFSQPLDVDHPVHFRGRGTAGIASATERYGSIWKFAPGYGGMIFHHTFTAPAPTRGFASGSAIDHINVESAQLLYGNPVFGGTYYTRAQNTAYALNDVVRLDVAPSTPTRSNVTKLFRATTIDASANSGKTANVPGDPAGFASANFGDTIPDGGVTWTCESPLFDWHSAHTYAAHTRVVTAGECRFYWQCDVGGTSGSTNPFFDTVTGLSIENMQVPNWTIIDGSTTGRTGTAATIASGSGDDVTITGLSGMSSGDVGMILNITNAAQGETLDINHPYVHNNGAFQIKTFISSTSVVVTNKLGGYASDANNGSIHWEVFGGVLWYLKIPAGIFCRTHDVKVNHVNVFGFDGFAWHCQGAGSLWPFNGSDFGSVKNLRFGGCGGGLHFKGTDCQGWSVEMCEGTIFAGDTTGMRTHYDNMIGDGAFGFYDRSLGNNYHSCYYQGSGGPGYYVPTNTGSCFTACRSESSWNSFVPIGNAYIGGNTARGVVGGGLVLLSNGCQCVVEFDDTGATTPGKTLQVSLTSQDGANSNWEALKISSSDDDYLNRHYNWVGWSYQARMGSFGYGQGGTGWWSLGMYGPYNGGQHLLGVSNWKSGLGHGHLREYQGHFVGGDPALTYLNYTSAIQYRGADAQMLVHNRLRGGERKAGDKFAVASAGAPGTWDEYVVATDGWRGYPWVPHQPIFVGTYNGLLDNTVVEPTANGTPIPATGSKVFQAIATTGDGVTGSSEPTWAGASIVGDTITETTGTGSVTWKLVGFTPTYARSQFIDDPITSITPQNGTDWVDTAATDSNNTAPKTAARSKRIGSTRTQTTNNTSTTIATYTLPSDGVTHVNVVVGAFQASGTGDPDAATFVLSGAWYRDAGGAPVQVRAPTVDQSNPNANGTAWTAVLDIGGNDVRVRVTGDTGKTIQWGAVRQGVEVTQ